MFNYTEQEAKEIISQLSQQGKLGRVEEMRTPRQLAPYLGLDISGSGVGIYYLTTRYEDKLRELGSTKTHSNYNHSRGVRWTLSYRGVLFLIILVGKPELPKPAAPSELDKLSTFLTLRHKLKERKQQAMEEMWDLQTEVDEIDKSLERIELAQATIEELVASELANAA